MRYSLGLIYNQKKEDMKMKELRCVGHSVIRSDAEAKVRGTAIYTEDLIRPDMLVAKALWPKYPHALIKSIDTSKAAALEGVAAVMTAKDLPGRNSYGPMVQDKPVIAEHKVCYEGDPVAILAAVDEETALRALALIEVEYEVLKAYDDPREAIKDDAVIIHPDSPLAEKGNLLTTVAVNCGDVDDAFAKADIIIENDYETPMVDHAYFEQDICIAEPDLATGGIKLISPNQAVFQGRRHLAGVFNLPQAKINCVSPLVGGGFGGKEDSTMDVSVVAGVLALKTKKPVYFLLTREEVFRTTGKRHASYIHHKLGAMKDGTIVAMEVNTYLNKGAYVSMGGAKAPSYGVTMRTAMYAGGAYYIPNARVRSYSVFTNNPYGNAFRGFGVPQVTFAMECQMEELARVTGIGYIAVRRKNMFRNGHKTITGSYMTEERGLGLGPCFEAVDREMGCTLPFDNGDGHILRGRGIAAFMYGTGIPLLFEGANVNLTMNTDGSLQLGYSSTEMGQGISTTGAQLAAEVLGLKFEDITVTFSDTQTSADSGPTVGSRSATIVGNAICNGAQQLKDRFVKVAAGMFGVDERNVDSADSKFFVKGNPSASLSYPEVITKAYMSQVSLSAVGSWYPPQPRFTQPDGQGETVHAYAFGAQAVELEVDTQTGEITLLKSVYAADIGKAINPMIVEGQIEGAAVQAMGWALMEEHFMEEGKMENASFHKFLIPTTLDVPPMTSIIVECPNELGPYGVKGIGEPGIIPGAPAIRNAFWDATGIKMNTIPLTPVRVLEALEKKKLEERGESK